MCTNKTSNALTEKESWSIPSNRIAVFISINKTQPVQRFTVCCINILDKLI